MKDDFTPILAIDFDGVIHSYTSGWKGARAIPDPPVPGAIAWLRSLVFDQRDPFAPRHAHFDVCIFSSRSRHFGGRNAIKRWLLKNGMRPGELEAIRFPLLKPPAHLLIDDRAMCFQGQFPSLLDLKYFRPWYKPLTERERFQRAAEEIHAEEAAGMLMDAQEAQYRFEDIMRGRIEVRTDRRFRVPMVKAGSKEGGD